ncbi:hypothetical protein JB92DRAFT_3126175 [Gautieria morchelliformis]|nr:hypothetical protein JB92DRAFT_3126175 [Gautieria morchelliformis]
MSSLAELEALGLAIFENRMAASFDLASIVILVSMVPPMRMSSKYDFANQIYDYLLTFKLELELVWGTPWNVGKILYMLTRYSVFVDSLMLAYFHFARGQSVSPRTCSLVYQISGWFIFWGGCLAEIVLIFRTWAIWGQKRKVAFGLPILMVIVVVPLAYLTRIGLTSVSFADVTKLPIPNPQSCFITRNDDITILWDYVIILGFETVILVLTLIKGVQHYRHTTSSLVSTLYADGILYYVYLLMLSIANVLVIAPLAFKKTSGATLVLMQRVFHAILPGRILLHLRMAAIRDRRAVSSPQLTTMFRISRHTEFPTDMIGRGTWLRDPEAGPRHETTNSDGSQTETVRGHANDGAA